MTTIKLVISDLHLADGHAVLDGFGEYQQSALAGLLNAASMHGPLSQAGDVELIINGDCFDFLTVPPYDTGGTSDADLAVEKLAKIISAHRPFFQALCTFIAQPGRRVTFITGNHDIDLCFAQIRAGIYDAIGIEQGAETVQFCPTRFYRPLPDVYIEHGNAYDFWNRDISELWDAQGQPLTHEPHSITLPSGSHYLQHAALPINLAYPYIDHFEPSMSILHQMALLSLINPQIVIGTVQHTLDLLSQPRDGLAQLAPGDELIPARLFEQAMLDLAEFYQDAATRHPGWAAPPGIDAERAQADTMTEFAMLREALNLPSLEAIAAACTPATYQMGESVAAGMHNVLRSDPTLRYAIAGHTHMVRIDPIKSKATEQQVYLNTGSWTTRVALPAPGEITAEVAAWLRRPDWTNIPLRDVTQFTFALIEGEREENQTHRSPSSASLCVWKGGKNGHYRVLA
jgi:UDP-2,3-diacylglucosamine pyrophosphatase LpxH